MFDKNIFIGYNIDNMTRWGDRALNSKGSK